MFDPHGFLHMALSRAHDDVGALGNGQPHRHAAARDLRVCLVQEGAATGRTSATAASTSCATARSSSARAITATSSCCCARARSPRTKCATHPMRNFVECCIGGDPALPEMTISGRHALQPGDVLLLCTDGIWADLRDTRHRRVLPRRQPASCAPGSKRSGRRAVQASAPFSDNTHCRGCCCAWPRPLHASAAVERMKCRDPAAARPTSCARCASRAASRATPKARCWSSSATPACCAPPASRTACRRSCAARARAGSPPSTACCRARPTRAATARPRAASRAAARWRSSA